MYTFYHPRKFKGANIEGRRARENWHLKSQSGGDHHCPASMEFAVKQVWDGKWKPALLALGPRFCMIYLPHWDWPCYLEIRVWVKHSILNIKQHLQPPICICWVGKTLSASEWRSQWAGIASTSSTLCCLYLDAVVNRNLFFHYSFKLIISSLPICA